VQPSFKLSLAVAAIALALPVSGCFHHHRPHPHHGGAVQGQGLTVVGTGEAKGSPDIARTSVGIELRADTSEKVIAQANERMGAILSALRAAGVADTDLRTHDYVSFERDYSPEPPPVVSAAAPQRGGAKGAAPAATVAVRPSEPRGSYRVSNMVEVTVRNVARVSAVLTAATNAGANNVYGINFDVANPDPLHEKAREQAISRAKQVAKELAKLTGVKLGSIVTIEDQAEQGQGQPRMYRAMAAGADANAVPVQGGDLTVSHQVRLVYELAR
jgi:uncharacterized protein